MKWLIEELNLMMSYITFNLQGELVASPIWLQKERPAVLRDPVHAGNSSAVLHAFTIWLSHGRPALGMRHTEVDKSHSLRLVSLLTPAAK